MNILEVNRSALANMYEQFPDSFNGLRIQGEYLVFGKESCNISKFNIYDLIDGNSSFSANLDSLTAEDIFKIIRLHSLSLESKDKNNEKLEIIKRDNPLLKNVTIIPRNEKTGKEEIINIVDTNGRDNLFVNTYRIDFFDVYETVKAKIGIKDVTPEDLIDEFNRRIYQISLESAHKLENNADVSKDFQNKVTNVYDPFRGSNSVNVYGDEGTGALVVSDSRSKDDHEVVTFDQNEFGDTIVETHRQDIEGQDSIEKGTEERVIESDTEVTNDSDKEALVNEDKDEELLSLISTDEFYNLLIMDHELSTEDRKNLETYYAFLGDLMLYEEYLLPELRKVLNQFRAYVLNLNVIIDNSPEGVTVNQRDCVAKAEELEENAVSSRDKVVNSKLDYETTSKRTLKLAQRYKDANAAFVSTFAIIACIIIVVIILTIITLTIV